MSLSSRLSTWLDCFSESSVQWAPLTTHGGRFGVVLELRADLTLAVLDEDDEFEHLLQLREAIDLVRLTLAVEPRALQHKLTRRSMDFDQATFIDCDAISALLRGAPAVLRLRFEFRSIRTRLLEQQLAAHFIHSLGESLSFNDGFVAVREELVEKLKQNASEQVTRLMEAPVPITIDIDSGELAEVSLLDADDFFVYLTAFASTHNSDQREKAAWAIDAKHTPLVVDRIELQLQRFCITHRVVTAAKTFRDAGIAVDCKRLNLDPRLISCADGDVHEFVATLSQGATMLVIETGIDVNEEGAGEIDDEGQDRRDNIRVIFDAIAGVERIHSLNLSGLLTLCFEENNRREIFRCLFRSVLTRASPIETLVIGENVSLTDTDVEFIRDEVALWRESYPDRKVVLKGLRLDVTSSEVEAVEAVLSAVDDVEDVSLRFYGGAGSLPTSVVDTLMRYPSLKSLSLGNVSVQSMDIFDPTIIGPSEQPKPVLQSLRLDDLLVVDKSSMIRFFDKLRMDTETRNPLASYLRSFQTRQHGLGWADAYRADAKALQALERALETNTVIQDVAVLVDNEDATIADIYGSLTDNANNAVQCERLAPIAKARHLAFLSVIRGDACDPAPRAMSLLDAGVVSRVLEFAAPHETRWTQINFWSE